MSTRSSSKEAKKLKLGPAILVRQVKAARALLAWSQSDLAEAAGISAITLKRLESADGELGGSAQTRQEILHALKVHGIELIPPGANGPGVRIRENRAHKVRAGR